MKRLLILLICAVALLCGCDNSQPKIEDPVTFYYPRAEYVFGQSDSVIASETREAAGKRSDLHALLNEYLQSPVSAELRSPFPDRTRLKEIRQDGAILQLVMNDGFAQLSEMELTITCACLAKTSLTLTDCTTVQIIMEGSANDTNRVITMDTQSLLLMDDIITTTPTEIQEGL